MDIRGFVFDIDGTICNFDGLLNLEAAHSIRWLRNLGYPVILSSGRGPWDTFYLGVYLGCSPVAVCENGGLLMASPSDLKIYGDKMKSLEAYDLLSGNLPDVRVKPVSARLTEVVLLRTFDVSKGQEILDKHGVPVTINDSKFALHLTKTGINKGKTLIQALRTIGLDPKQIAVVGDSDTDLPMFQVCGYSAAVGNAPDHVKSKANYACRQEIGDGAVEAVSYIVRNVITR
ncbi:MAG TPA: phosphoglycolate phosphatase [Nitrososphaerales archaeon]|nr:phosphoglycolate phosphatase [Nitrososphaerales archaeon]